MVRNVVLTFLVFRSMVCLGFSDGHPPVETYVVLKSLLPQSAPAPYETITLFLPNRGEENWSVEMRTNACIERVDCVGEDYCVRIEGVGEDSTSVQYRLYGSKWLYNPGDMPHDAKYRLYLDLDGKLDSSKMYLMRWNAVGGEAMVTRLAQYGRGVLTHSLNGNYIYESRIEPLRRSKELNRCYTIDSVYSSGYWSYFITSIAADSSCCLLSESRPMRGHFSASNMVVSKARDSLLFVYTIGNPFRYGNTFGNDPAVYTDLFDQTTTMHFFPQMLTVKKRTAEKSVLSYKGRKFKRGRRRNIRRRKYVVHYSTEHQVEAATYYRKGRLKQPLAKSFFDTETNALTIQWYADGQVTGEEVIKGF